MIEKRVGWHVKVILVFYFVKDLFELNEDTSTVLGVQKDDRVSVSTNLGFGVDGSDARGLNLGKSVFNVVDLQADVVHASTWVLGQKVSDRALFAQRLEQFDVGAAQKDKNGLHTMIRQFLSTVHND